MKKLGFKKIFFTSVVAASVIFSGCGSDKDDSNDNNESEVIGQSGVDANTPVGNTDGSVTDPAVSNDQTPPVFTAGATLDIEVAENFKNSYFVTILKATDDNSITYAKEDGADKSKFYVDKRTGELRFLVRTSINNPKDIDGDNIYNIVVSATDAAGHKSLQTINVTVVANADAPADTAPPSFTTAAVLNVKTGTKEVVTLNAIDASAVSYTLEGGADMGLFTLIGPRLSFTDAPTYDPNAGNSYAVEVKATDRAGNFVTQAITVNVTEDVVIPPVVNTGTYSITTVDGLDWQTNVEINASETNASKNRAIVYNWDDAKAKCDNNDYGLDGTGWRLPTVAELETVTTVGESTFDFDPIQPWGGHWSSNEVNATHATVVFADAVNSTAPYTKGTKAIVRCVK